MNKYVSRFLQMFLLLNGAVAAISLICYLFYIINLEINTLTKSEAIGFVATVVLFVFCGISIAYAVDDEFHDRRNK